MYQAMLGIHWFLPRLDDQICTVSFLEDVRYSKVLCPKDTQIVFRNVLKPPTQKVLRNYLLESLKVKGTTSAKANQDEKKKAAAAMKLHACITSSKCSNVWLTRLMSTYFGNHAMFIDGYTPPVNNANRVPKLLQNSVDNFDGMYDHSPELTQKQMKAKGKAPVIDPVFKQAEVDRRQQRLNEDVERLA